MTVQPIAQRLLRWKQDHQRWFGCAINTASPRVVEIAAQLGFDVMWIELEHGAAADWGQAEALSIAAQAGGALPLIRTPSSMRHHVLRALEIGGRIIVVPLVNDAATAREIVRHAKFRPLGERGFNLRSRGMNYGLDPEGLSRANESNCLLAQIETLAAVRQIETILQVDGLDGIFIGPGDLSMDLGRPAKFDDPELIELAVQCLRAARKHNKHAAILCAEGALLDAAMSAGADLCISSSDLKPLIDEWRAHLARVAKWKTR